MAKRKVGYYYLVLQDGEDSLPILNDFLTVMNFVKAKMKADRIKDLLNNKVCFLEDFLQAPNHEELFEVLFKSAKHSYRAPLVDKNTAAERENPKTLEEGELYKTHIVLNFHEDNNLGIAYIENAQNLLSMQQFVQYINYYLNCYNETVEETEKIHGEFKQFAVTRSDFRETLTRMCRVSVATLIIDKSIVGSNALCYSNQIDQMQEDVQLTLKAKRSHSIKNAVYGFLERLNNGMTPIKRMKIQGKLDNNNDCIIDTEMFAKKEYIDVNQNAETGEFDSASVFAHLINLVYDN